jgi:hypothetical protein
MHFLTFLYLVYITYIIEHCRKLTQHPLRGRVMLLLD